MKQSSPDWKPLARELARSAETEESTLAIVRTLPGLLSSGASALEVARSSSAPPQQVGEILDKLSKFEVVSFSTSGSNIPFGDRLYYLRGEGQPFFSYLDELLSSSTSQL